jgi:hypothetical protein
MGAINFRGAQFVGEFGELTGYKSGLALSDERFREIFAAGGYERFWPDDPDAWLRIRAEMLEEIFAFTLAQIGVGPQAHVITPLGFVFHRVKNDPEKLEIFHDLGSEFIEFLNRTLAQKPKKINPVPFIKAAQAKHGVAGLEIALMITEASIAHQVQSHGA